jgi:hypothetical protein
VADASWQLKGTVLIACNCDYGCPCNFNALPSRGSCEGGWTWHVDDGEFDGVRLDDLNFSVYVKWPGAIHHGDGEAVILFDERADDAQRQAIETLVGGDVGGPWGILAWTWPTVHGPHPAAYDLALEGIRSRLRVGETVELQLEPVTNPVTGAEVTPSALLPQGIITKHADLARSTVFRIADGIALDHSGQYTAVGPFDYSG